MVTLFEGGLEDERAALVEGKVYLISVSFKFFPFSIGNSMLSVNVSPRDQLGQFFLLSFIELLRFNLGQGWASGCNESLHEKCLWRLRHIRA